MDGEDELDFPRLTGPSHITPWSLVSGPLSFVAGCLPCRPPLLCLTALSVKCTADALGAPSPKWQILMLLIVTHYIIITFSVELKSFQWEGKESSAALQNIPNFSIGVLGSLKFPAATPEWLPLSFPGAVCEKDVEVTQWPLQSGLPFYNGNC